MSPLFKHLSYFSKKTLVMGWLAGVSIGLLVVLLRQMGVFHSYEMAAYDFLMQTRDVSAIDNRIVLIALGDEDFDGNEQFSGYGYPIPDKILADALDKLTQADAAVIGVDIYRPKPVGEGGDALKQAIENNQTIIWIKKLGSINERAIAPPKVFADKPMQVGFNDVIADIDVKVRRGLLSLSIDNESPLFSFAMMMSLHYLANTVGEIPHPNADGIMQFGKQLLTPMTSNFGGYHNIDESGYQFLYSYQGMPAKYPKYPLHQWLADDFDVSLVANKIVLIGTMAKSVQDYFYTPYSEKLYKVADSRFSGLELHAYAITQLIDLSLGTQQIMRVFKPSHENLLIIMMAIIGASIALLVTSLCLFILSMGVVLALLVAVASKAFSGLLWLPLAPMLFSWVIALLITAGYMAFRQKQSLSNMMQIFSRHVSSDVANMLWEQRDELMEHNGRVISQRLQATILFSDLRGFTTISESMDAAELMEWLNNYMDKMSGVIIAHGGVIDKFIGDAVMAVFGIPIPHFDEAIKRDANHAVRCALAMEKQLIALNKEWDAKGLPNVGMRIGIASGEIVAGSMGSKERSDYTVVGDIVNTAARLESFDKTIYNKDRICRILISDNTRQLLEDGFKLEAVASVALKGKEKKVKIHMIMDEVE